MKNIWNKPVFFAFGLILLLGFSACKPKVVYPHEENPIFPLQAGNFWEFKKTVIQLDNSVPVDTVVTNYTISVSEIKLEKIKGRKHIEVAVLAFDGDNTLPDALSLYSTSEGIRLFSGRYPGEDSERYFGHSGPFFLKYPCEVGDSWSIVDFQTNADFGMRYTFDNSFNLGYPDMDYDEYEVLSLSQTYSTPAGTFDCVNLSGEYWAPGVGRIGMSRVYRRRDSNGNLKGEDLLVGVELVGYSVD